MAKKLSVDINKITKLYEKGLSCPEISEIVGARPLLISRRLRENGVVMRNNSESHSLKNGTIIGKNTYRNKDWLYNQYHVLEKSQAKIAEEIGTHQTVIHEWMDRLGIISRKVDLDLDNEYIKSAYESGKSTYCIGEELNVSPMTISRRLKGAGVEIRGGKMIDEDVANKTYRNKEWLMDQYVAKKRPIRDIADECGINYKALYRYFDRFGIERTGVMDSMADLSGETFSRLTVIIPCKKREHGGLVWLCECACGNFIRVRAHSLVSGHTCSCGCLHKDAADRAVIEMAGLKFGRWSVIKRAEKKNRNGVYWLCQCLCGNSKVVLGSILRSGGSKSCGCLSKDILSSKVGMENPNWNPELTDEDRINNRNYPEYREWREAVFGRDNYTCQKCGRSISGNLNAHHIESHDVNKELRTNVENGVTLCADKCHPNFHHIYGYGHNTRDQFNEFMLIEDV